MGHDPFGFAWSMALPSSRNGRPTSFAEISLKKPMYSLLLLILDWIVKELSNFWARSWVLHDFPAFRLGCDPIEAGLITQFRRISLNFPLECQTSVEKETAQIHFNPRELKPHLHDNRVASEIWEIIWR